MNQSTDHQTQQEPQSGELPRPEELPDLPEGSPFAAEWRTFKREVARLLAEGHTGRFVLIKGADVVGTWPTPIEAIRAGHERFGREPFFVQEVQPFVRPLRLGGNRRWHP
jgi:hypothetical protein